MTENARISFLDLITPHRELREQLLAVVDGALSTASFIGGPMVEGFERDFAKFCDTQHCVGVSSGTDALRFALMAAGIGTGDIVITVPNTFIATTEAISQSGAEFAFVDIAEATYNLDPAKLREYIEQKCSFDCSGNKLVHRETSKRVAAIVPVHLYGQMADMDPILEIANEYNLVVIEDACQAHGAEYFSRKENRWRKAGSMGKAAAFSFYPGKNLGACGEAGALTTSDPDLAQKARMLRDHGQAKKYYHDIEGYNGRLDAIQAGMLSVKLKYLAAWTEQRRQAAKNYRDLFDATGDFTVLPYEPEWAKSVYHLFVVRVQDREQIQRHLAQAHIDTGIHYPIPLHLQKAYSGRGYAPESLPVAERVAAEILSLPMFPGLTHAQQSCVVERLLDFRGAEVAISSR
jgi:dTDP-4-amino-4,6-dideoxygalactose transaminase